MFIHFVIFFSVCALIAIFFAWCIEKHFEKHSDWYNDKVRKSGLCHYFSACNMTGLSVNFRFKDDKYETFYECGTFMGIFLISRIIKGTITKEEFESYVRLYNEREEKKKIPIFFRK